MKFRRSRRVAHPGCGEYASKEQPSGGKLREIVEVRPDLLLEDTTPGMSHQA